MEENPLLSLPEGMQIDQIQASENEMSITVIATHPTSCCPLCCQPSCTIHSRYRRMVRDVPCGGRPVQLTLCVRKYFCRNPLCERKVFTERLPELILPWAQMTIRYSQQLTSIGLATCGKGGTQTRSAFGDTDLSPNDPAPHHGSPQSPSLYHPLPWNRRFFVPAWLPVRHHPRQLGEQAGRGSLAQS